MKKILILLLVLFTTTLYAKKVKFAVDLTGLTVNPLGVHVAGDFQVVAGYGTADWTSNSTPLNQEGTSNIYSIVVDIPAFQKYEFKFLNGDQWYDSEFVPEASRVGYQLNDSRWIYVDSIANDTTIAGPVMFGGNAPIGKYLLRFKVDMRNQPINSKGIHVAGNFVSPLWSPNINRLYSFDGNVYELITYVDTNTFQYKYYNGNTINDAEIIPANCSFNGNRQITVLNDTVIDVVCYADCIACVNSVSEYTDKNSLNIYPNPARSNVTINLNKGLIRTISLFDVTGKLMAKYENINQYIFELCRNNFTMGLYFVQIQTENDTFTKRLFFY